MTEVLEQVQNIADRLGVRAERGRRFAELTSLRVGGAIDWVISPKTEAEAAAIRVVPVHSGAEARETALARPVAAAAAAFAQALIAAMVVIVLTMEHASFSRFVLDTTKIYLK